jgi:hypothetical protein
MIDHKACAAAMLEAIDTFMSGAPMTAEQLEVEKSVVQAGAFAAAAYDQYAPRGGGEYHALTRAFLLALMNPAHPDLDYLRAAPKSGEVARLASSDLETIAQTHVREGRADG